MGSAGGGGHLAEVHPLLVQLDEEGPRQPARGADHDVGQQLKGGNEGEGGARCMVILTKSLQRERARRGGKSRGRERRGGEKTEMEGWVWSDPHTIGTELLTNSLQRGRARWEGKGTGWKGRGEVIGGHNSIFSHMAPQQDGFSSTPSKGDSFLYKYII